MAGRHVVSRRGPRRAARHGALGAPLPDSFSAADGFDRSPVPARPGRRAHRKFHQRRAVRPRHRAALGHGVSRRGRCAASSVPAVPGGARGLCAIRPALVVFVPAAAARAGERAVPHRLRRVSLYRRVRPRARCVSRPARLRPQHGAVAVHPDGPGRYRAIRVESTLAPVMGAVLPVFGLVACGYLAGCFALVSQASSHALNQFVYAFALPAMLFIAVYRGSLDEILSGAFLLAVVGATLGTALVGFLLSHWHGAGAAESTMRALNASFANTGYLGIPLVTVAYGERAALPAALATVATNIVSFALAIVCLELFVNPRRGGV